MHPHLLSHYTVFCTNKLTQDFPICICREMRRMNSKYLMTS